MPILEENGKKSDLGPQGRVSGAPHQRAKVNPVGTIGSRYFKR